MSQIIQYRSRTCDMATVRHRLHLCAYATVAFGLLIMGAVFSGFAIFERQSEISKIWLAGPTSIAVALVLCGKVMIDRRPRLTVINDMAAEEQREIINGHIDWRRASLMTLEANALVQFEAYRQIAKHDRDSLNVCVGDHALTIPIDARMPSDNQIWNQRSPVNRATISTAVVPISIEGVPISDQRQSQPHADLPTQWTGQSQFTPDDQELCDRHRSPHYRPIDPCDRACFNDQVFTDRSPSRDLLEPRASHQLERTESLPIDRQPVDNRSQFSDQPTGFDDNNRALSRVYYRPDRSEPELTMKIDKYSCEQNHISPIIDPPCATTDSGPDFGRISADTRKRKKRRREKDIKRKWKMPLPIFSKSEETSRICVLDHAI